MSGLAVRVSKAGGGILLIVLVLGHVRPHLERQRVRSNLLGVPAPMSPAPLGGVIGAAKPPLIPAQNLVSQGCGVDLGPVSRRDLCDSHADRCRPNHASQNQPHGRNDVLTLSLTPPDAPGRKFAEGHWPLLAEVRSADS